MPTGEGFFICFKRSVSFQVVYDDLLAYGVDTAPLELDGLLCRNEGDMEADRLELIEAAAMQLPQAERAILAEHLLESLDKPDDILAAWVEEAERRADAHERGDVPTVTLSAAMQQALAGLPDRH